MRDMYLELSQTPPSGWSGFFDQERSFPRHSMWRRAWIEGKHIVIDCVPEELERYHLSDLKEDVSNANLKYDQAAEREIQRSKREEELEKKKADNEKERLDNLKGRLDFD